LGSLSEPSKGRWLPAQRVLSAVAIAGAAALVLLVASRAGTLLVVSDVPVPADATFLTYSVNSFARPDARQTVLDEALRRYRNGEGPHVLMGRFISEDDSFETRTTYAKRVLLKGGVPEGDIEVLPPVRNEHEEAQALRAALAGRGWRRVVAYAPEFRARRTAIALKAQAPPGTEIRVVAVPDPDLPLGQWWRTGEGIQTVLNEYPRLALYWLRGS
jgi:hypothetical protein